MIKTIFVPILFFFIQPSQAQFSDQFSDGDFTSNPGWISTPGDFIVNNNFQLQSNNTTASASFYISTQSHIALNAQWEFWVKLDFNPSSANYADVWLTSSQSQPDQVANAGYFVRIGSSDDDISLYKKTVSGSAAKIIDGTDGLLNKSGNTLKIKVLRTSSDEWILMRDISGSGNNYVVEGKATDNTVNTSSYFSIFVKQSTSSFFQKHYFDDISVGTFTTPTSLHLSEVKALSSSTLLLSFDQPLDAASISDISHYHINSLGNPLSATLDPSNGSTVILNYSSSILPNTNYSLIVNGVQDIFGNSVRDEQKDFNYFQAARYDVVIDELFADVSPQVGLPAQKFIELKNTATSTVNLKNWKLSDGISAAIIPDYELKPDSFLIITTISGLDAYKSFGSTIAVSNFPSLNISGGQISLINDEGGTIHAVKYDLNSYKNELKKQGGFSLEMINTKNGCGGVENWTASNDITGGTPGRKNSVDSDDSPSQNIQVLQAYLTGKDTLNIVFNKSIDSTSGVTLSNYTFSDGITVLNAETISPFYDKVKIILSPKADSNKIYNVTVNSITDCMANGLSKNTARFGVPANVNPDDIVINEILFDPKPGGSDYLELYNRSNKVIDVGKLYIANRNSSGLPANFVAIFNQPFYLFPESFLLLTTNTDATVNEFPMANKESFLELNALPSFSDDSGTAIVMDQQGQIIDEINYNKNWHFSLLKDKEGVSLERISYDGPSDQTNFHSAATTVNGTPGYKNSQSSAQSGQSGEFILEPEVFSPDNDGTDDFLTIRYEFKSPGFVTNIKIFDASGRMVRYLEKNSLSGMKGYYRWDGLDDKNQKLPQGIYIIYFESFNADGAKEVHKKTVVLARRF